MGAMVKAEPAGPSEWLPAMTIEQAVGRYKQMVEFVSKALVDGTDYGKIPGTGEKSKATLLKPGAEKLCTFFGLRKVPVVLEKEEDWTGANHGGEPFFYYAYRYELYRGDVMLAAADGSCNSWEKKYRWRTAERVCPECGKPAIIRGKEEYGGGWLCWKKKDGCGRNFAADDPAITDQQVGRVPNADPADTVNTIQKMAQKRALIAATLLAVNASDYFTQDLEDQVPDEHGEVVEGPPVKTAAPPAKQHKPAPPKPANGDDKLPRNGVELRGALGKADARFAGEKVIVAGELLSHMSRWGTDQGWSDDIFTWHDPGQLSAAMTEARKFIAAKKAPKTEQAPPDPENGIQLANRVRELGVQAHLAELCTNAEDLTEYLEAEMRGEEYPRSIDQLTREQVKGLWAKARAWVAERQKEPAAA